MGTPVHERLDEFIRERVGNINSCLKKYESEGYSIRDSYYMTDLPNEIHFLRALNQTLQDEYRNVVDEDDREARLALIHARQYVQELIDLYLYTDILDSEDGIQRVSENQDQEGDDGATA